MEHCPHTSLNPPVVQWTGLWERSQRRSCDNVQPELAVSLLPPRACDHFAPEACTSRWPFPTWARGLLVSRAETGSEFLGLGGEEHCERDKPPQTGQGAVLGVAGVLGTRVPSSGGLAWQVPGAPTVLFLRRMSTVIILTPSPLPPVGQMYQCLTVREGGKAPGQCGPSRLAWTTFLGEWGNLGIWPAFGLAFGEHTFLSLCLS